ncbi:alpha/beta-hydrolase [Phaeosphaeriaceae sp. SRC1lsM3a]|nr:alpha/beta-hydrolase [Stagonospora sp. SRC1lsM3a]
MSIAEATAAATTAKSIVATKADISIEVLDQGSGPVIVILPSLGRGAKDYDIVAQLLEADGFRIVRPQPRGIGLSKGPMHELTLHDFAADVAQAMDHLQVGPAVIVGHAWGSQPARMLAADRPDLVSGLIMAAASAGKLPPGSNEKPYGRLREEIDGAGNMALSEEQRLDCLRKAFFAPGNDPRIWLDGWYAEAHDAQAHARIYTPIDEYFSGGGVVPMLDLQGEYDAVVVKDVFKPLLGDRVEVRTVSGVGHAMAPEQPRDMAKEIAAFARRFRSSK